MRMVPLIRGMLPALRFLVSSLLTVHPVIDPFDRYQPDEHDAEVKHATQTMNRIGKQLMRDSRAAILSDGGVKGKLEKSSWRGRDLLSLLLRANMSTDLPPNQRMTEEEVLAREYPRNFKSRFDY